MPLPRYGRTLAAVLVLTACAADGLPDYAGPTAPGEDATVPALKGPDIEQRLKGKTLVAAGTGSHWVAYIRDNGLWSMYDVTSTPDSGNRWSYLRGAWRVKDDAFCMRSEGNRDETCFRLRGTDQALHAYRTDTKKWWFSARVEPGNPTNL